MENKRTKEQTINALKSMANGFIPSADCEEDAIRYCESEIAKDALAIIDELTEENERLRADKEYWKKRAKESESEYDQAVKRGYELGTVDSVRSFAERLKAETITIQDHTGKLGLVVLVGTIDQIAKEMLEK